MPRKRLEARLSEVRGGQSTGRRPISATGGREPVVGNKLKRTSRIASRPATAPGNKPRAFSTGIQSRPIKARQDRIVKSPSPPAPAPASSPKKNFNSLQTRLQGKTKFQRRAIRRASRGLSSPSAGGSGFRASGNAGTEGASKAKLGKGTDFRAQLGLKGKQGLGLNKRIAAARQKARAAGKDPEARTQSILDRVKANQARSRAKNQLGQDLSKLNLGRGRRNLPKR